MAYKVLTKQQWDSLPAYTKYQMRDFSPALYNYYQDRYVPKAEPVSNSSGGGGSIPGLPLLLLALLFVRARRRR